MARAPLSSAAEITPGWLTEVLRRHESLAGASVTDVAVESTTTTLLSAIATLRITYALAVPAGAPRRLFLKMSKDEEAGAARRPFAARKEVAFYRTIAPAMTDPPVPRCYDAIFDDATGEPPSSTATAHVWNVLYPKDGLTGGVNIIDWDNWRPATGARDLVYMMAVHWYPERRRRFEHELLLRYQRELEAHGVAAYDMDALWRDYRLALIQSIATPLSQAAIGLPPLIWWGHLERIMLAYEDLDCEALMSEF